MLTIDSLQPGTLEPSCTPASTIPRDYWCRSLRQFAPWPVDLGASLDPSNPSSCWQSLGAFATCQGLDRVRLPQRQVLPIRNPVPGRVQLRVRVYFPYQESLLLETTHEGTLFRSRGHLG